MAIFVFIDEICPDSAKTPVLSASRRCLLFCAWVPLGSSPGTTRSSRLSTLPLCCSSAKADLQSLNSFCSPPLRAPRIEHLAHNSFPFQCVHTTMTLLPQGDWPDAPYFNHNIMLGAPFSLCFWHLTGSRAGSCRPQDLGDQWRAQCPCCWVVRSTVPTVPTPKSTPVPKVLGEDLGSGMMRRPTA